MYNTALPVIFGVKHYADALWKVVEKRDLKVNLRTNLVEVLPNGRQAIFENLDKPGEKTTVDVSFGFITNYAVLIKFYCSLNCFTLSLQ